MVQLSMATTLEAPNGRQMTAFPELHVSLATLLDLPDVIGVLNKTKY